LAERIDPVRDADAEARSIARQLLADARTAALAFVDPGTGAPSISRIGFGLAPDGAALTLLSDLAQHTRALRADPRAALLVGEPGPRGDPLNSARLSVSVTAHFVANSDPARTPLRDLWLRDHPKSKLYVDFADFSFVRFEIIGASLNGGFGRAYRLTATDLI